MDLDGGIWTRYGKSGQGAMWNYVDEDLVEVTLEIISPEKIQQIIDLMFNDFLVQTDVAFRIQGDNSENPSELTGREIPQLEDTLVFVIGYGGGHTRLEYVTGSGKRKNINSELCLTYLLDLCRVVFPRSMNNVPPALSVLHYISDVPRVLESSVSP